MNTQTTTKHTAEPWTLDDGIVGPEQMVQGIQDGAGTDNEWIALGLDDEDGFAECTAYAHPSNAARIIACVNACAGMEDPAAALAEARTLINQARGLIDEGATSTADNMLEAALRAISG